jgi:hypothetical protein
MKILALERRENTLIAKPVVRYADLIIRSPEERCCHAEKPHEISIYYIVKGISRRVKRRSGARDVALHFHRSSPIMAKIVYNNPKHFRMNNKFIHSTEVSHETQFHLHPAGFQ